MLNLRLYVDRCTPNEIAGWIDEDGPVGSREIKINGEDVGVVAPNLYRRDLELQGLGDGQRGWLIRPGRPLKPGDGVMLSRLGKPCFTVWVGKPAATDPATNQPLYETAIETMIEPDDPLAHELSQVRWRGDEGPAALTFGVIMSALWEIYSKYHVFEATDHILEVGPGYGRLLKTALERRIRFGSYTGVELSEARVKKLSEEFGAFNIRFVQGDIDTWCGQHPFDVVMCSSTFEHMHPDCRQALRNIRRQMNKEAIVFIDFIAASESRICFGHPSTYIRTYPQDRLAAIFAECDFIVQAIEVCAIGQTARVGAIQRFVVIASPAD